MKLRSEHLQPLCLILLSFFYTEIGVKAMCGRVSFTVLSIHSSMSTSIRRNNLSRFALTTIIHSESTISLSTVIPRNFRGQVLESYGQLLPQGSTATIGWLYMFGIHGQSDSEAGWWGHAQQKIPSPIVIPQSHDRMWTENDSRSFSLSTFGVQKHGSKRKEAWLVDTLFFNYIVVMDSDT